MKGREKKRGVRKGEREREKKERERAVQTAVLIPADRL